MKKTLAMILALVMLLALSVPCFAEGMIVGQLAKLNTTEEILNEEYAKIGSDTTNVFFDDLTSMLLALQSGKIDRISAIPSCVAEYIAKTNDKLEASAARVPISCLFCMGTLSENKEVYELLNSAIETLKENGTLEKLQKEYIDNLLENGTEPTAVELLPVDGAKTIKVAVTGDLPPIDYVAANGTPAGFNVALLAEISKLANVNIELVQVNSASRLMALTQGTVDAVFCFNKGPDEETEETDVRASDDDIPESVKVTTEYYTSINYRLSLK